MKTIVILGAGHDQVGAYVAARRLGYCIIGFDGRSDAPAAHLADKFHVVSTRDASRILDILRGSSIHGVVNPGSDAAQEAFFIVASHFRTPLHQSWESVRSSTNKPYCLAVAQRLGFRVPKNFSSDVPAEFLHVLRDFTFPVVIKPVDRSGSKGISLVTSPASVSPALKKAIDASFLKAAILEEFIIGAHYSAELFLFNNRIALSAISRRSFATRGVFVTRDHSMPAILSPVVQEKALRLFAAMCKELQINAGPVNFDFVVDENQDVILIEMQARLGGNGMPILERFVYDINTYNLAIELATGELYDVPVPSSCSPSIACILYSPVSGVFRGIIGLDTLRTFGAVKEIQLFVRPGQVVTAKNGCADKVGYVILQHSEPNALQTAKQHIFQSLRFDVAH